MDAALDLSQPQLLVPGANRPFAIADFVAEPDEPLRVRATSASDLPSGGAGTLFAHPLWLRTYGAENLLAVEGVAARLVFARRHNELRHLGRLLSFEPACIDFLTARLLRLPGVGFVVFEDVHVAGGLEKRPGRSAFRYQNNWQLPLNGPGEAAAPSRQTAQATARKLRALTRERQSVRVGFDRNPSDAFLRRVVALNRAKIEAQGRRHGIDEVEFGRLRAISAELGHGAALTEGDALIAGDLICIADNRAYFLTGGYEPDFQRFSPGMITLSHAIEACRRRGILDFNLLWGDGVYKQRLGGRCQPLVTIVSRRSAATLLRPAYLAALSRFGWLHLKRALKPMLTRLKGLAPEKPGADAKADLPPGAG
ncbi:MAG TPA: GNAT family N-acetyltransferase [Beijerinckiaceae bacterium]|nr:GNAT family N-acetyltransferase [Beijerinckiaceae bacterium]